MKIYPVQLAQISTNPDEKIVIAALPDKKEKTQNTQPTSQPVDESKKKEISDLIEKLGADPQIRGWAVSSLVDIGKQAVPALIKALKHKNENVRSEAARTLGKLGDKHAVSALIEALENDKDFFVRVLAAQALGKLGDKHAVPALTKALKDVDAVHMAAEEALEEIRNPRPGSWPFFNKSPE
jgi:HEAT repeat protein